MDVVSSAQVGQEHQTTTSWDADHCTKPYRCGYCSVTFTLSLDIVSHVESHILAKPYQCALCNEKYETSPDLTSHLTVHNLYLFVPKVDNVPKVTGKLAQRIATAVDLPAVKSEPERRAKTFADQCTQTYAEIPEQQAAEPSQRRLSNRKRSQTFKLREVTRSQQAEKRSEDSAKENDTDFEAKRARPRKSHSDSNSSLGLVKVIKVELELEDDLESSEPQRHVESDGVTEEADDDGSDEEYVPVRFGKGTDKAGVENDNETEVEELDNDSDDAYVPASGRKKQKLTDSEIEKSSEDGGEGVQQKSTSRKGLQNLHQIQAKPKPSKLTFCRERQKKLGSHVRNAKLEKEKILTCRDCGKSFNRIDMLRLHRNTHLKVKPHHCKTCNKGFCSLSSLVNHQQRNNCVANMEDGVFPKQCKECNTILKDKYILKKHMKRVHLGIRKHVCDVCNRAFHRPHELKLHSHTHSDTALYRCKICNKGLNSPQAIRAHLKRNNCSSQKEHVDFGDGVFPKKCTDCDKVLKDRNIFFRHIRRTHQKIENHICEVCSKGFYLVTDLNRHRFTHAETKPHYCSVCKTGFGSVQAYRKHQKRNNCVAPSEKEEGKEFTPVDGTFPGQCRQCDKVFFTRNALKKHVVVVHKKVRPHVCEYCAKAFSRVSDLKIHVNIHEGVKPFSCQSCDMPFSSRQALNSHQKRNRCLLKVAARAAPQEVNGDYTTVEGTFPGKCRHCDTVLGSRNSLVNHVQRVHLQIKEHKCDLCERAFSRQSELVVHRKAHAERSDKQFHCEGCQVGFDSLPAMKSHYNRVHGNKPFDCPTCGRTYSCKDSLRKHVAAKHSSPSEAGESFNCPDCDRNFSRKQALKLHQKAKHDKKTGVIQSNESGVALSGESGVAANLAVDPNQSQGATLTTKNEPTWKPRTVTSAPVVLKQDAEGMQVQIVQPNPGPLYEGVGTVEEQIHLLQCFSQSVGTNENIQIIIEHK